MYCKINLILEDELFFFKYFIRIISVTSILELSVFITKMLTMIQHKSCADYSILVTKLSYNYLNNQFLRITSYYKNKVTR